MSTARPAQGFPRSRHIRRGNDFREISRRGKRHQDDLFTVHGLANGLDHARLGVTVSRKVALRANRRNRIKRHIRESFRMHQPALRGLDIVVVARSPANQAEAGTLRESLEKHWIVIKAQCKPRSSS